MPNGWWRFPSGSLICVRGPPCGTVPPRRPGPRSTPGC